MSDQVNVHETILDIAARYITIGAQLYTVYVKKEYLGDHPNFRSYIKEKHKDIGYPVAIYSIQIYKMFERCNISLSDIYDVPWSRLSMLRHLLNKYNCKEFLTAARTYSDDSFEKKVKGYTGAAKGKYSRLNTGKRTLHIQCDTEEQHLIIKGKLDNFKEQLQVRSYAEVIEYLLISQEDYLDYLSLDALLNHIEKKYPEMIFTVEEL